MPANVPTARRKRKPAAPGLPEPVTPAPMLSLSPVLDLNAAAPLRSLILMHRGHDLDLDAADVERVGGLCLQVLLAARQTWAADQKKIRLINPSEACRDALRLAQASATLGLEA